MGKFLDERFDVHGGVDDIRTRHGYPGVANEQHRTAGFLERNGEIAR